MKEKLLLLHGALGSKKQFNSLIKELEISFDVYTMNFEGHGGVESFNDFSIGLFTKNVIKYLEELGIDNINIFGYSMGGYVALQTALNIPKKINKIITLGTKFNWDIESAQREVKMLDPIKIEEKVPRFAKKLQQEHHPEDWKKVMKKTAVMIINMAKGNTLNDSDFKKIDQPVIIGIGDLDSMVSYEESKYIYKILPNAKLVRLEGVEHPIEKIDLEQLANFILSN